MSSHRARDCHSGCPKSTCRSISSSLKSGCFHRSRRTAWLPPALWRFPMPTPPGPCRLQIDPAFARSICGLKEKKSTRDRMVSKTQPPQLPSTTRGPGSTQDHLHARVVVHGKVLQCCNECSHGGVCDVFQGVESTVMCNEEWLCLQVCEQRLSFRRDTPSDQSCGTGSGNLHELKNGADTPTAPTLTRFIRR